MEPTLGQVRRFWTDNPLFTGESGHAAGSREWFTEHESVYLHGVFADEIPAIFSKGVAAGTHLLDAGCGPGFWVRYFQRLGVKRVAACDLTTTAAALTKKSLSLFGLKAQVAVGDIEHLPYGDGTFDHVNCQGVVHHTPDTQAALLELRRVLRPGGTFCFSVYHRNLLLRRPAVLKSLLWAIRPLISLKGRGRESLLAKANAEEIVRLYDGSENPIGRAYTVAEITRMIDTVFTVEEVEFFYFPSRMLPFAVPVWLHAWLGRRAGLMVALRCRAR